MNNRFYIAGLFKIFTIFIVGGFVAYTNVSYAIVPEATKDSVVVEADKETYDLSNIDDTDTDAVKEYINIQDDLEPLNRAIFSINKGFDELLIKPLARLYEVIVPQWGRDRVDNFINNLYEPISFINSVIQRDEGLAQKNMGRFISNTVLGVGGLFDIAGLNQERLAPQYTDFGLTLRHYGATTGTYLVLPLLGSSGIRDIIGFGIDSVADPFTHVFKRRIIIMRYVGETIHYRSKTLDISEDLSKTSLDEYATVRSIYFQKRH